MNTKLNSDLRHDAAELIEYWEGTMHARILRRDLLAEDVEALRYHMDQAHREMILQEDYEFTDVA